MDNIKIVDKLNESRDQLFQMISKVIIGQKDVIDHLFIALLCRGHVLLEGVPGLAKTLLIKTLSDVLDLKFNTILLFFLNISTIFSSSIFSPL